jgi:hypothetical protein
MILDAGNSRPYNTGVLCPAGEGPEAFFDIEALCHGIATPVA